MGELISNIRSDISSGIYFSKGHAWVCKNSYGLIKIGITDYLINQLGNVSISFSVQPETSLKKGDKIFEVVSGKKKFIVTSPLDGILKFVNPAIKEKQISDPYGDDWIALIAAENFLYDKSLLMYEQDYIKMLERGFILL